MLDSDAVLDAVRGVAVTDGRTTAIGIEAAAGTLAFGRVADVGVLTEEHGRFTPRDNTRDTIEAKRVLRPAFCLRARTRHDAGAPVLP